VSISKLLGLGLMLTLNAGAQSSLPSLTTHSRPDGLSEGILTNLGTSSIIAFHVKAPCPPDNQMQVTHDNLLHNEMITSIAPGGTYALSMPVLPQGCTAKVDAVLYVNGSTAGEPEAIEGMFSARKAAEAELVVLRPTISKAAAGQLVEQDLAENLAGREDVIDKTFQGRPYERQGHRAAILEIEKELKSARSGNKKGNTSSNSSQLPDFSTRATLTLAFLDNWSSRLQSSDLSGR
jgi:hypothetical protein